MSNDGKLYVKSTCLVCLGKNTICYYCTSGLTYVEAANTIIKQWLQKQPQDVIDYIVKAEQDEKP